MEHGGERVEHCVGFLKVRAWCKEALGETHGTDGRQTCHMIYVPQLRMV
jgi:hypothetical protein